MAYADYKFYTESFGNVVPETDFPRLAERASDFVDAMTFDRLADGLPANERSQKRIKKAVCSLAELMYQIELAEKNAINQASANLTDTNVGNISTGVVTSVSSGSESISYATPQQKASGALYASGETFTTGLSLSVAVCFFLAGIRISKSLIRYLPPRLCHPNIF